MADKQSSPTNTREQAVNIKQAWTNIGTNGTYGDIELAELEAIIARFDASESTVRQLEDQLVSARNTLASERHTLWELVKRVRMGAKAKYGDDSNEYERFGGTRISERRSRRVVVEQPL